MALIFALKKFGKFCLYWSLALCLSAAGLACGVKGWPEPLSWQDPPRPELAVSTSERGVEVSFTVPTAAQADRVINQVIFQYTYLPLREDPECPACPPVLNSSRVFSIAEPEEGGQSASFVMVDDQVPYGQQAVYRALWQDRAGRRSAPSSLAYGYNLVLPPPPARAQVSTLEDCRRISWQKPTDFSDPLFQGDQLAYAVERRGPEGTINLTQRPLSGLELNDYSANPSRTYRYRVRSLRVLDATLRVTGPPGAWLTAAPFGRSSARHAPRDLLAVSLPAGIYLRFEPLADPEVQGYIIERRQEGQPWLSVSPPEFGENTLVDRQVKTGQYYEYRVMALEEEGDYSEPGEGVTILHLPQGEGQ
jgi:hypothetical protein